MPRTPALVLSLALLSGGLHAAEPGSRYLHLTPTVPGGQAAAIVDPATIPTAEYVIADKEGHLMMGTQRQRFWGVIGGFPNEVRGEDGGQVTPEMVQKAYSDNEALITRFQDLGFNLARFWRSNAYKGHNDYVPGDGSPADVRDHFVATAKAKGFHLWAAGLNHGVDGISPTDDVSLINDPNSAAAWQEAVADGLDEKRKKGGSLNRARYWDPRLEAYAISNMVEAATHFNKYTGLRWCDDPVFAAFELSNEEWWVRAMLNGEWQKTPTFFRNSLVAQWNAFLLKKYASTQDLTKAWNSLLPGEDPTSGTVLFAPMAGKTKVTLSINDGSAHAQAAVDAMVKQEYGPADFNEQRARDVLQFLEEMQITHKTKEANAIKPLGRATQQTPLAWDTGIGYEIQSAWLHQHADATVHDAYVNGRYDIEPTPTGPFTDALQELQAHTEWGRKATNRGQWVSWLEKPPGISQGVPWLEHNKVVGKPFFCYETQIQQPAKYRADYPLRFAALASIQDWDIACWHYWGGVGEISTQTSPFARAMDNTTGSHPQGYHYTYDEVQNAMMRAAGTAWRNQAWKPAPKPTTFIYGSKSMTDPTSMRYAGSYGMGGMDMLPTTYQHGVRIEIDPTREDDAVIGPVVKATDYEVHNPYDPTSEITFDWKKGYLKMDAPASMTWTGFLSQVGNAVTFQDGSRLEKVTFNNPEGIYEPITAEEGYIAFSLYSEDGKPLAETKQAALSLMSSSFNTGFSLEKLENGKTKVHGGGMPVLVTRVGAQLTCRAIDGMRYTLRDWHMDAIGEGVVSKGVLEIPADKPVWMIELTR